jgi:GNAT superfamily N-acetyltransferase
MNLKFQLAAPDNLDLLIQFVREFYEVDRHHFDEAVVRNGLLQLLNDASLGRLWLIVVDGEAVGYTILGFSFSLEFRGRDAFVDELYLREEYRGCGLGTRTLQFVEETALSLGIKCLHLEVERENVKAQQVYHRCGYRDHDRYLMTKWLKGQ